MRYLLVSEGKSDRMLFGPINWLMNQHCQVEYEGEWANPGVFEDTSRVLQIRLAQTALNYPCDLAFVHRDTDTVSFQDRVDEITAAVAASGYAPPIVCAIPVRMTEAWFLFDAPAIRRAADKPTGRARLSLPTLAESSRRADPKQLLEQALLDASELDGRRRDKFRSGISGRKHLLAQLIDDYSPLRNVESFATFENSLVEALAAGEWA